VQTEQRESVQRRGIPDTMDSSEDRSIYHLVLDTSLGSIEDTAKVFVSAAIMVRRAKKASENRRTLNEEFDREDRLGRLSRSTIEVDASV